MPGCYNAGFLDVKSMPGVLELSGEEVIDDWTGFFVLTYNYSHDILAQ